MLRPHRALRLASPPLLLAALLLGAPARAQPAESVETILPGYWTYTASTLLVVSKTERRCIRRHEIDRVMAGAINHHYTCSYPNRVQSNGRVQMSGVCSDKKGRRIPISMNGRYTPTTLDVNVQIAGVIPGVVHGRRLSATCPGGQEP